MRLQVPRVLALLQREFDENEVDPYHGQQDKRPEPEAMDLPDDLNLDQDGEEEEAGDDAEGKGQRRWTCFSFAACFSRL